MPRGTPQYFVDGELAFPPGHQTDGTYRTKFGGASHTGLVYANNDHNFNLAIRRLTGKRLPLIEGKHEELQANQETWFANNVQIIDTLRNKYSRHFELFKGSESECREHYIDPHPKKALREKAFKELEEQNLLTAPRDLWVKSVWWKLKKAEYAKPGKKPRGICDLGVSASLRGAWLTNALKVAQSEEVLELEGGRFAFCKSPDPFELEKHFDKLINLEGRFYFVYFSDDSCLSIRDEQGRIHLYNLDISSCDASHGPSLFAALINLMPTEELRRDMTILVDQCKLPLRIHSCVNKKRVVFLRPRVPKLLSGSTITTAINNLSNLAIALAIVRNYHSADPDIENPSMVDAAAQVGYILTGCKPLTNPNKLQFLKHSPVRDVRGNWKPMLNFGVLVRASMTCNGDLPGRGPILDRALSFQRGLLRGAYPHTCFGLLENMWRAVGDGPVSVVDDFKHKVVINEKYPPYTVMEGELAKRYDLDSLEMNGLIEFSHLKIGQYLHNEGLTKVLELDYGLGTCESSVMPIDYHRNADGTPAK